MDCQCKTSIPGAWIKVRGDRYCYECGKDLLWTVYKEASMKLQEFSLEELRAEVDRREASDEMQHITDHLHGLLCDAHGGLLEDGDTCVFYIESQMEHEWTLDDHRRWIAITMKILDDLRCPHDWIKYSQTIQPILDTAAKLKALSPEARALVMRISSFND